MNPRRIGRSYFNTDTFEITGAVNVTLTFTEGKLLRYFIENPDRVISKEEFMQAVWKSNALRSLYTYVKRLRDILKADNSICISMKYKKGYELIERPREKSFFR